MSDGNNDALIAAINHSSDQIKKQLVVVQYTILIVGVAIATALVGVHGIF